MKELMRLQGICKVFDKGLDELVCLDDINLTILEGEYVCILGPSRCGKSTLLKIIGGIENGTEESEIKSGDLQAKRQCMGEESRRDAGNRRTSGLCQYLSA